MCEYTNGARQLEHPCMASAEVRTGNFTLSPSLHLGCSPSIIPLPYLPSSSFSRRWASTAVSIHSALKEQAPSDTYLLSSTRKFCLRLLWQFYNTSYIQGMLFPATCSRWYAHIFCVQLPRVEHLLNSDASVPLSQHVNALPHSIPPIPITFPSLGTSFGRHVPTASTRHPHT